MRISFESQVTTKLGIMSDHFSIFQMPFTPEGIRNWYGSATPKVFGG
jgi:hypothetical protein